MIAAVDPTVAERHEDHQDGRDEPADIGDEPAEEDDDRRAVAASGTPRTHRKNPTAIPSKAAMTAVPRRYPPTRWSATSPAVVIASRRQVLADDIAQTHALSPSIRKKNVRKVREDRDGRDRPDAPGDLADAGGQPRLQALRRTLDGVGDLGRDADGGQLRP